MNRAIRVWHRRRGHTLVDVMTALLVFSFTATSVMAVHLSTALSVKRSKNTELATAAAKQQLDRWRQAGFDAFPPNDAGSLAAVRSFPTPDGLPSGTGEIRFEYLDESLEVTPLASSRRRLTTKVNWQGRAKDQGIVTLTTMVVK